MYSFVIKIKPKSYNSWGSTSAIKKNKYKLLIEKAFRKYYPTHIPEEIDLYGLVYYFYQKDIGIDADNLSKPIWDCLLGILFDDDNRVKMRIAGSFDLTAIDFAVLNSSGLPGEITVQLVESIGVEDHILYVECGTFTTDMIRLNLERNGN